MNIVSNRLSLRLATQLSVLALLTATSISNAHAQVDLSEIDPTGDEDADNVPNLRDNCLLVANPEQRDFDNDGYGDLCDADLNNDGKVNALDLGLLQNEKRTIAQRDLNGDGEINDADVLIIKRRFLSVPGPSLYAPDQSLRNEPPSPSDVKYLKLNAPGPNGEEVVVTAKFTDRSGGVLSMVQDEVVQFNDLGISPDGTADDGVYTAFSSLRLADIAAIEQKITRRNAKRDENASFFAGRSVVPEAVQRISEMGRARALVTNLSTEPTVNVELDPEPIENSVAVAAGPIAASTSADHSIAIHDPDVVAHPLYTYDPCDTDNKGNNINQDAPWSFKTLMANMAAGSPFTTQHFIHNWLNNWMYDQTINGDLVPARIGVRKFFPGWDPNDPDSLDVDKLPYRLLAIMNRLDLAQGGYIGVPQGSGEIRFVFGLLEGVGTPDCQVADVFEAQTVIFEYGDPASSCSEVQARADQWIALSDEALGSTAYMDKLQQITDLVTVENANIGMPNGSVLNQLRVNDFAFDDDTIPFDFDAPDLDRERDRFRWELREFRLFGLASPLHPDPLDQTPAQKFRETLTPVVGQFVEENWLSVACREYSIPFDYQGHDFAAGAIRYSSRTAWNFPLSNDPAVIPSFLPCGDTIQTASPSISQQRRAQSELRHTVSLNACDDCHAQETDTRFVHVSPTDRSFSGFLTGNTVADPFILGGAITRSFNDILRRRQILEALSVRDCSTGRLLNPQSVVVQASRH